MFKKGDKVRYVGSVLFNAPETKVTDASGASKNQKPVQLHLVPVEPLAELAALYARGHEKYPTNDDGRENWTHGYAYSLSYDACQRHLMRWLAGEDDDPEMGYSHLASAAWHLFSLMTFQARNIGTDDRKP